MKKAIEAVAKQKKSLRQAAREYGVKSTTVENVEHGMKKMDSYGLGVTEAAKGGIMSSVLA